ncbi:glycosyltransferase [Ligilactobacillus salivarius]|nr:glycosyltransferase [Ligilactobacillus salivarius]
MPGRKITFLESYLPNLDEYVVLNEITKEKIDANFGIDSTVIYNPKSYVSKEKSDMESKVFLAAGRMVYAKGFDTLVEAFRIFAQRNSDWKLLLVGDGEELPTIKNKIKKYGLEKRIYTPGKTSDIKEYFLQSSVLLLPSRWEGMPMIVLESLEMGCPIVAFDIDAMRPLVTNGMEGLIVKEKQDANAYAQAMLKIAESEDLRKQMHQASIKKANRFSVDKIMNEWEKLFK